MTKLDAVIERIRQLPAEQQDAIAVEMEFLLKYPPPAGSALSAAQWAEVDAALADSAEETVPHEDVMARARAKLAE